MYFTTIFMLLTFVINFVLQVAQYSQTTSQDSVQAFPDFHSTPDLQPVDRKQYDIQVRGQRNSYKLKAKEIIYEVNFHDMSQNQRLVDIKDRLGNCLLKGKTYPIPSLHAR